jgi:hypothetical protein
MHPNTPPTPELEKIKKELLDIEKKTDLDYKKLKAVTVQLEDIREEIDDNE